ncbi:helix-turn-helix domain-containing protein [Aeromonas veronii]|uniref:helix-turn-helix domain-containing protein n=1 Tax=Aeromonas veronii TaxID=654 RepID=UPI00387E7700
MITVKLREALDEYKKRTGVKMTYRQLSEETGLSQATIASLGSRSAYNSTLGTIDAICKVLSCSPSELLEYKHDG